ncbi:MAG: hemerythrin domain-containing protein [Chloroflexota bacterium]|nr:hemerythrin domain-containing protein [Chloroflexota bacterium]
MMEELIQEHIYARELVNGLVEARQMYVQGEPKALDTLLQKIGGLVELYPEHIKKEDDVFFPASMDYLTASEQDAILEELWECDREMIHDKYRSIVERLKAERMAG